GKLAVDIEHATDGGGFAPGLLRAIIDVLVHLGESGRAAFEVAEGGEPAVGGAAGHAEDARLVGADPDADVVGRFRAAPGAVDLVELAVDARATLLVRVPDLAHDLDPFLERLDGLAGRQAVAAHRLDALPEGTGTDPHLDAASGEEVEAGRRAGEDRRVTQRQVEDVTGEMDVLGA